MGFDNVLKFQQKRGKKKPPKSFLKRFVTVAADSHHLSSDSKIIHQFLLPAQWVQLQSFPWNGKRVSNPWVPMSWTSLFSLYKTGFKLWALMSSIVQSFMDQNNFFPFDYWNWKKSCTVLKSLINCCGKISLQGYLVAFVKRPLIKNRSSNKLGQVKARPTELC